jgi:hypothetical protein
MLSSVLDSPRAIAVNIAIMRVFVQLREMTATYAHLARKLDDAIRVWGRAAARPTPGAARPGDVG